VQVINGLSCDTFISSGGVYSLALRSAVAQTMTGCHMDDVNITSCQSILPAQGNMRGRALVVVDSLQLTYTVRVIAEVTDYTVMSDQLVAATQSREFKLFSVCF
jgi:hypothetical protein